MMRIADAYRRELGELHAQRYLVPTGSGECIVCLRWAYPDKLFTPVVDGTSATGRDPRTPLYKVAWAGCMDGEPMQVPCTKPEG